MQEHKHSEEYFSSPIPLSFAVAARTKRVKVGTSVALSPVYNPVVLAQDAAMLDQLSGGRLFLGLGAGYLPVDFQTVGVAWEERMKRFDEGIRVIKQAWTEPSFSFHGEMFRFDNISVIPKPYQKPAPPIYLAAWSPGGLRRAGRLGDGWISNALMSRSTMKGMADAYRAEGEKNGRKSRVVAIRFCWPARTREEASEVFGPTSEAMARTLWRYGALTDMPEVTKDEDITIDTFSKDRFIFGTPDECVQSIEQFASEVGVDEFLLIFRYPTGPSHEKVMEAMRLFSEEVMPHFTEVGATSN
jgi:probable F420-dependent oxidoreductase